MNILCLIEYDINDNNNSKIIIIIIILESGKPVALNACPI
jgi:hypothetical protein